MLVLDVRCYKYNETTNNANNGNGKKKFYSYQLKNLLQ